MRISCVPSPCLRSRLARPSLRSESAVGPVLHSLDHEAESLGDRRCRQCADAIHRAHCPLGHRSPAGTTPARSPLHESFASIQRQTSGPRSPAVRDRWRRRVHGAELHGLGPNALAVHAGVVAAVDVRGRRADRAVRRRPGRPAGSPHGADLVRGDLGVVLHRDGVRALAARADPARRSPRRSRSCRSCRPRGRRSPTWSRTPRTSRGRTASSRWVCMPASRSAR